MSSEFLTVLIGFSDYLFSQALLDAVRLDPKAFRRVRKLPFPTLITFLMSGLKASVQNELNTFFPHLNNQADLFREVSAQAFSEARKKFSAVAFSHLNQQLLGLVKTHLPIPRWYGLRVVAADASKVKLFLQDITGRQVREAIAFGLYLPDLEMSLAFELYPPRYSERQMLFDYLDQLSTDDLLVLDRGYPACWWVAVLTQRRIPFCMRVDNTGYQCVKAFLRSGYSQQIVTIRAANRRDCADFKCTRVASQVRLVRIITPNGNQYVVMTSLLDPEAFPVTAFLELYHSRWRIEEAFKRLKHHLNFEHLSGLTWLAAQQDFGAKVLCDNLNAFAVYCATDGAGEIQVDIEKPTVYRINRTYAFAHLKRCLSRWVLKALPSIDQLITVFDELLKNLTQFIKGRSNPRPRRPKPHMHHAYRPTA